ncbi:hypothetical protein [Micromonospora peucetia]|uniref:Uncharacterized protein n=1 Tax=Micromonospora peucetia TaxID=47871 RepID=A0A1C6VQY7_9ACTN|nr:hypothetical protein [Micromonospora peucetia]SCL68778.1 hypothetical protein GA0070608_3808 [Micromonospora peucetia]
MSTFDEYAALARQLAERRRAGERGAAADAERRRNLHATADYLQHRLTAQGQRLDQLGQAIGIPASSVPTGPAPHSNASPATAPTGPAPHSNASPATAPTGPAPHSNASPATAPTGAGPHGNASLATATAGPGAGSSAASGGEGGSVGAPFAGAGSGEGESAGAAGVPGRPGVGAYPQVGAGETRLALPTAVSPAAGGVPAPRPAEADPTVELELVRRYADESDRHGQQTELLAQRPPLLPDWSPVARAVAVYAGCAAVGATLMMIMVLASGVGLVDGFTLGAWICAGLPALSFFAGYLVLGRWGRPAMVAGTPPRYVHFGFLICFAAVPVAYLAFLLLFRVLR